MMMAAMAMDGDVAPDAQASTCGTSSGKAEPLTSGTSSDQLSTARRAQEVELAAELSERIKAEGLAGAEWATVDCCLRYVRARRGKPAAAEAMVRESLRWRESFGVSRLAERQEDIRHAGHTGKVRVSACRDRAGRPVLVLTPRLENQRNAVDPNLVNLVYHLERCIGGREGVMTFPSPEPSPDGKAVVVMDFRGYSFFNNPPMRASKATLSIFQNHYPERLHKFIVLNAPTIFYGFYKVISPFIDPVTKAKVQFVVGSDEQQRKVLDEHFDLTQLESSLGGGRFYEFSAEEYFSADPEFRS
mmetsp:Transcript_4555/g.12852  ORF Transcript_4555/g.12852 Transcript_4555/m.12852 type:complete len:302 (+) Transcript_4555:242-1147(+)